MLEKLGWHFTNRGSSKLIGLYFQSLFFLNIPLEDAPLIFMTTWRKVFFFVWCQQHPCMKAKCKCWLGLMLSNPGVSMSFSDHLFSYYMSSSPDFQPWATDVLTFGYIFNNVHLLVYLQFQVKTVTKTNTEPAGALAKQRLSLLPTERVGWEWERRERSRGTQKNKTKNQTQGLCESECWKNDLSVHSVFAPDTEDYHHLLWCIIPAMNLLQLVVP